MGYEIYLIFLTLTILSYGLGPVIFAFFTERVVSKRKLMLFSVVYTFLIWMAWVSVNYALNGDGKVESNTGPAFLWGIIFYWIAKKRMRSEGRIWERPRQEEPKGPATEEGLKALTHLSDKKEQANSNKIVPMKQDMNDSKPDEHTSSLVLLAQLRDECEAQKKQEEQDRRTEKKVFCGTMKAICFFLSAVCCILVFLYVNQILDNQKIEAELESMQQRVDDIAFIEGYLVRRVYTFKEIAEDAGAFNDNSVEGRLNQSKLYMETNYVCITKSGDNYHKEWCSYAQRSPQIISISAAIEQGYIPCSFCFNTEKSNESESSGGKLVKTGTPDYVFITESEEYYHMAGCKYSSINATRIFILDAIAQGYKPCSYCLP